MFFSSPTKQRGELRRLSKRSQAVVWYLDVEELTVEQTALMLALPVAEVEKIARQLSDRADAR